MDIVAKRWIYGTGVTCILWFLVAIFALIIFQCSPVDAYWNQFMSPAVCLDAQKLLLGYEITNLLIDVVILCIPAMVIGKLQLNQSKKIGAVLVFLLGALSVVLLRRRFIIISNVRLIPAAASVFQASSDLPLFTTHQIPRDPVSALPPLYAAPTKILSVFLTTRKVLFSQSIIWSTIQAGFAIICSCLPILGPLIGRATKNTLSTTKRYGYPTPRSRSATGNVASASRGKFQGLDAEDQDNSWSKVGAATHTWNSTFNRSNDHILQPLPANGILVNRQIDVV